MSKRFSGDTHSLQTGQLGMRLDLLLELMGESLISTYESDVREARLSLRRNDPVLDANLNFWGRVQSFQSPEAQLIHDQKFIDLRRSIGRSV